MTGTPENPNLKRRLVPGLFVWLAAPLLNVLLRLLEKAPTKESASLTVFQSYMVGDLYMALPALKTLAGEVDSVVICRPDCAGILGAEGLKGIPFENAFRVKPGIRSFFSTWGSARKLRGLLGATALDFDADPRTAFWLRIAGVKRVASYNRSGARLFNDLLPMPAEAIHQADRDMAVVRAYLETEGIGKPRGGTANLESLSQNSTSRSGPNPPWILSCWTRKDTKNWPLLQWEKFLERLWAERIPFQVVNAPDGDPEFHAFRSRWSSRVEFLGGALMQIAKEVQACAGVIATDNFLGHMAGYYGKPVLWINGSSDPRQVQPQGPKTRRVQIDPMPCRPCGHRCVNHEYKACFKQLSVESVWRTFGELRAAQVSPANAPAA